jgi:predicted nucleotidyltransferase
MDLNVVAQIDERLDRVEAEHGVRILWAVESGSRAWGFPSPDSDYDARFIYIRASDDYLSFRPFRDVIETPLDETFDVNGWDIRKVLGLLVSGNATPGEWLRSPIVYRGIPEARDAILAAAAAVVRYDALINHHYHVAIAQSRKAAQRIMNFCYVTREAMTLRWLRLHHSAGEENVPVPPMDLPTLSAESDVPAIISAEVAALIVEKSTAPEKTAFTPPSALTEFNAAELDQAQTYLDSSRPRTPTPDSAWTLLDATFRQLITLQ